MRELLQLGLGAAQVIGQAKRAGRGGSGSRWITAAAGAFMVGDAAYSLYASRDSGTGMQIMRVARGALGAIFLAAAITGRGK